MPTDKVASNIQEQNRALLNGLRVLIENEKIFAIVLGLLIEPLQQIESPANNLKTSKSKSLQLVLTFFRNILIIADEEDGSRIRQCLSSALLKYNFLDVLLVLVQNHKKVLGHDDMSLTIEILQILFRGIPADKLAEKISDYSTRKSLDPREYARSDLKKEKFQMTRFIGKFEHRGRGTYRLDDIDNGKKRSPQFNTIINNPELVFTDEYCIFWHFLLQSTHFGAFIYHGWKDIVRTSGDHEQHASEWQTRCYNLLLFSGFGLRILSNLLFQHNHTEESFSIEAVADIFESSYIHWLRIEWQSLENKKEYYGANLICTQLLEITSIIQNASLRGSQIEKDVSKFLIQELYLKSKAESILEQVCMSLRAFKDKSPTAYLFSLVHILNFSLKIIEAEKKQFSLGERPKCGIYDESVIFSYMVLLKNATQTNSLLESVLYYMRNLINAGQVEKLFTLRHLTCLSAFGMASKTEPGPNFELILDLHKVCRFVLNCFLSTVTRSGQDLKSEKRKLFLLILLS